MSRDGSCEGLALPRPTARVVLRAPNGWVLMLEGTGFAHPDFWCLPGGGVERGESLEDCARREVYEETSYEVGALYGPVWRRAHTWRADTGLWYRSQERFFVSEVPYCFDAAFARDNDPEQADISAHRWWSVEAMEASGATFAPRRLSSLLRLLEAPYGPEVEVGL